MVTGPKTRERAPTDDNLQAALFFRSLTEVEQDHLVNAFRFELGKVDVPAVVDRMLGRLANVDTNLCERVAAALGVPAPDGTPVGEVDISPALRMVRDEDAPADGRVVQILVADGGDATGVALVREELLAAGVTPHVVAPHKGSIAGADGSELTVDRSFLTSSSVECDAIVVGDAEALLGDPEVLRYVQEAYRHQKTVASWGTGRDLFTQAGFDLEAPGVIVSARGATKTLAASVVSALGRHRHWDRTPAAAVVGSADRGGQ
jgi:catalase